MSVFKTRYYLKVDEGMLRRLPKAFIDWPPKRAFRQFAGTKQKYIEAVYDGGHLDLVGSYVYFDAKGNLDSTALALAAMNYMEAGDDMARAKRMAIPDLRMIIKAKAASQHRWKVTDADREAIAADLIHTGRRHKAIPILRST